jgi:hypothetical protein
MSPKNSKLLSKKAAQADNENNKETNTDKKYEMDELPQDNYPTESKVRFVPLPDPSDNPFQCCNVKLNNALKFLAIVFIVSGSI